MNIEEISALLAKKWGNKILADFRDEAAREATGTVYQAILCEGLSVAGFSARHNPLLKRDAMMGSGSVGGF